MPRCPIVFISQLQPPIAMVPSNKLRRWFCLGGTAGMRPKGGAVWISLASRRSPVANSPMRELPHTHSCFVCGESNAFGLKIRFETDGRIVQARFLPRPEHVGFQQT